MYLAGIHLRIHEGVPRHKGHVSSNPSANTPPYQPRLFLDRGPTLTQQPSRNTFPILEIFHDETLIFSPQVFLLGLLFNDQAFAAYNLTSINELSRLRIPSGLNELRLHLNRELGDILVFRPSVRTAYGWATSPDKRLAYSTLLPWIKALGQITGFAQVARPYSLRYARGKAFNDNGKLCIALFLHFPTHVTYR